MLSYTNWRGGRPDIKNNKFFAGLSTDGFWDIQTFNVIEEILQYTQNSILACKIEMSKYANVDLPPGRENIRPSPPRVGIMQLYFLSAFSIFRPMKVTTEVTEEGKDTVHGVMVLKSRSKM